MNLELQLADQSHKLCLLAFMLSFLSSVFPCSLLPPPAVQKNELHPIMLGTAVDTSSHPADYSGGRTGLDALVVLATLSPILNPFTSSHCLICMVSSP
jgi:hypothetical protein